MNDKRLKLEALKVERLRLSSRVMEGVATQAEKARLKVVRDEIRRLERWLVYT